MKKIVATFLSICTLIMCAFGTTAFAANDVDLNACKVIYPEEKYDSIDYSKITDTIKGYFTEYYYSIETKELSRKISDYIVDNENTHLYLKNLEYGINWRKELDCGIADSIVKLINLKNITALENGNIKVTAYIQIGYRYLDDETNTMTSIGDLWEIVLEANEPNKIISMDTESSDYYYAKKLVSENIEKNSQMADYSQIKAIDEAYQTINAKIPELKKLANSIAIDVTEDKILNDETKIQEPTAEINSVSVSYDSSRAKQYANLKGFDEDTKIFKRMSADCTNFISQCLWVGYGGDKGNNWYSDAGVEACRQLAYEDYRQIPGSSNWFGRSQISSGTYPSGPWMRVKELYSYLSTSSAGPRVNKYNNASLYTDSTTILQQGDILQLSTSASSSDYFHSVMVVSGGYSMSSNASKIYVGQHSSDNGYRQLSELIASNSAPYVRIMRPITGYFNS